MWLIFEANQIPPNGSNNKYDEKISLLLYPASTDRNSSSVAATPAATPSIDGDSTQRREERNTKQIHLYNPYLVAAAAAVAPAESIHRGCCRPPTPQRGAAAAAPGVTAYTHKLSPSSLFFPLASEGLVDGATGQQ